VIQNDTIMNLGNAGIHLPKNAGSATVIASVFCDSFTAPGASFPLAALFADSGGTATDAHHEESRRWLCRQ
jgi:hypothetical protein